MKHNKLKGPAGREAVPVSRYLKNSLNNKENILLRSKQSLFCLRKQPVSIGIIREGTNEKRPKSKSFSSRFSTSDMGRPRNGFLFFFVVFDAEQFS